MVKSESTSWSKLEPMKPAQKPRVVRDLSLRDRIKDVVVGGYQLILLGDSLSLTCSACCS